MAETPLTTTPDIVRPPKEIIEGLRGIGSALAAGELSRLGIRDPQIRGPVPFHRASRWSARH